MNKFMEYHSFLINESMSGFERDVLWSLVAHAMRARPGAISMPIKDMFSPWGYFMTQIGSKEDKLDLLYTLFHDGTFEFPWGDLTVENGIVTNVKVTG